MSKIYIQPFVGENYTKQKIKTMFLGESFFIHPNWSYPRSYDNKLIQYDLEQVKQLNANPEELKNQLGNFLIGLVNRESPGATENVGRLFRNTVAALTGTYFYKNGTNDFREKMDDYIFHEYITRVIGFGGHHSKNLLTDEMLKESEEAFHEIMEKHTPTLVVVWGKGTLSYMQHNNNYVKKSDSVWKREDYPNTLFWVIRHPSSFFRHKKHFEIYKKEVEPLLIKN